MSRHLFYIADVFAEQKYAGNQLGIIRQAEDISSEEMLEIAREMNYSETTFILSDQMEEGGYDVRIFTPGGEVPFAGHPTLGTAALIRKEIAGGTPDQIILNLKVGKIPVTVKDNIFWMTQMPPQFGETFSREEIAPILDIDPEDIEQDFPVQLVSTGLPTVIIPLRNLETVKRVRIRREYYDPFIERIGNALILVFTKETLFPDNDIHDRVLVPCFGIEEDPATGSGNGCLAAYLVRHKVFGVSSIENIRVEQGYQVNRPSLLLLTAKDEGVEVKVHVGGKVVFTAQGEML
ncbi:MAG: PhzF family phenazine biosynthesis protein [Synergistales bacterium]|nr:PhzF family phenazine biosynthesis protein [Synergistales bacterium]